MCSKKGYSFLSGYEKIINCNAREYKYLRACFFIGKVLHFVGHCSMIVMGNNNIAAWH